MEHLIEMLARQRALQQRLGYDFKKMSSSERVTYIKDMYIAAVQELGEALNETTWKPWSTGDDVVNVRPFAGELGDAFQFIMNMWFAAHPDIDIEGIARLMNRYHEDKVVVNHQRISDGYDGKNKCPVCRRALDDQHVRCDGTPSGCDTVMQTHPHSS